jgi:hypothetical protein
LLEIFPFGAGTEGIETLIALLLLPNHGNSDARVRAARRTRLYKLRQILKQAPSSDNVMAACGYLVLESLMRAVGQIRTDCFLCWSRLALTGGSPAPSLID